MVMNFFIFNNLFYFIYFIFGCVGSLLLQAGFSLVAVSGGCSSSLCAGFSLQWLLLLGAWALGARASVIVAHGLSSCGSWALEHRLSSCGARAQLLHGMWGLPRPGLEPVIPALAGGFLTTVPPGKPYGDEFLNSSRKLANREGQVKEGKVDVKLNAFLFNFFNSIIVSVS